MLSARGLDIARDVKSALIGMKAMAKNSYTSLSGDQTKYSGNVVLLSLGGRYGFPLLASALRERGYKVHVLAKKIPGHELKFAHKWHRVDCLGDFQKLSKVVKDLEPVGIFSEMKNGLLPVKAALQQEFNLRGIGLDSSKASNSKLKYRRDIDDAGVSNVQWESYIPGVAPTLNFPYVVKPEVGTGSRGVHFVRTSAELDSVSRKLMSRTESVLFGGDLLVEQFIKGRQFDVEGISRDGVHCPLSLTEEMYEHVEDLFPSLWYLFSPPISIQLKNKLNEYAKSILTAVGVKNGAWHCEIRIDESGNFFPIDFSNRMGYPKMVSEACGLNFLDLYVSTLLPDRFEFPNAQENTIFQRFLKNTEEREKYVQLEIDNPESVIEFRKLTTIIADVPRFGRVSLRSNSYEALKQLLNKYDLLPNEWESLYDSDKIDH